MNLRLLINVSTIGQEHLISVLTNPLPVISAMKIERGLALQDLITGAYEYVETIDFEPHARVYLLDQLAQTE